MSLETELETPVDQQAVETREFVTVISMTSNELIGHLFDILESKYIDSKTEEYKQMIIAELKLRMKAKKL